MDEEVEIGLVYFTFNRIEYISEQKLYFLKAINSFIGNSILLYSANGTIVGTVIATDSDAGQTLISSIILGHNNSAFAINLSYGIMSVSYLTAISIAKIE